MGCGEQPRKEGELPRWRGHLEPWSGYGFTVEPPTPTILGLLVGLSWVSQRDDWSILLILKRGC